MIIYFKTFTQAGEYHKSHGQQNEDAVKVLVNGDHIYGVISDGAGCGEAARCTAEKTADYCNRNGEEFFTEYRNQAAKGLVFEIQQALYDKAKELGVDLAEMKCTLVLLCIDTKTMQYTKVHVGDGLIAQITNEKTSVISYPENGITKQFTYFVNSKNVFEHLRISCSTFKNNDSFILLSDGAYENNCDFNMFNNKKGIDINAASERLTKDDKTYCIISVDTL